MGTDNVRRRMKPFRILKPRTPLRSPRASADLMENTACVLTGPQRDLHGVGSCPALPAGRLVCWIPFRGPSGPKHSLGPNGYLLQSPHALCQL